MKAPWSWLALTVALLGLWLVLEPEDASRPNALPDAAHAPVESTALPSPVVEVPPPAHEGLRAEALPESMPSSDESGFPVEFRITDTEGTPVPGARVRLEMEPPFDGTTDADGRCRANRPGDEDLLRVFVEADGFHHLRAHYDRRAELDLSLARLATVTCRILSAETGRPVSGAQVTYVHSNCKGCASRPTTAGPDGVALVDVPVERQFWIRADHPDFAQEAFRKTISQDRALQLELRRGRALSGRVYDLTSGVPLPEAVVASNSVRFTVDHEGRFSFRSLASEHDGNIDLRGSLDDYLELRAELDPRFDHTDLRLPLLSSARLEGRVLDASGTPISGATVRARPERGSREPLRSRLTGSFRDLDLSALPRGWYFALPSFPGGRTDEDGRYAIEGLVPYAETYELTARHGGFDAVSLSPGPLGAPGATTRLDFVLRSVRPTGKGSVSGLLTLSEDPIPGEISWTADGRRGGRERVDATGVYALEDLPAGPVTITVHACSATPTWNNRTSLMRTVTAHVVDGRSTQLDVAFEGRLIDIAGRVTRHDASPAAEVQVVATEKEEAGASHEQARAFSRTDADGRFALRVLDAPTEYRVVARDGSASDAVDSAAPGQKDLFLVLPETFGLILAVRDADVGTKLRSQRVRFREPGTETWSEVDATFERSTDRTLELLLPRADLVVTVPGYLPAFLENVALRPSGEELERIVIDVRRASSAEFRVAPGFAPLPAELLLLPQGVSVEGTSELIARLEDPLSSVRLLDLTREGADASVEDLAPGRYHLRVWGESLTLEPETIEIGAESLRFELTWTRD